MKQNQGCNDKRTTKTKCVIRVFKALFSTGRVPSKWPSIPPLYISRPIRFLRAISYDALL
jgi:hypothetical protein